MPFLSGALLIIMIYMVALVIIILFIIALMIAVCRCRAGVPPTPGVYSVFSPLPPGGCAWCICRVIIP